MTDYATSRLLDKIHERLNKLESNNRSLVHFAKWVLWAEGDWCGDVNGQDIQEKAEELGLIALDKMSEPCCDECKCAEVDFNFPVECYRYTEVMKDD